jgi:hypothetical protein
MTIPRGLPASIFAKEAESFGPGHPKVAIRLNNLAQLFEDEGIGWRQLLSFARRSPS